MSNATTDGAIKGQLIGLVLFLAFCGIVLACVIIGHVMKKRSVAKHQARATAYDRWYGQQQQQGSPVPSARSQRSGDSFAGDEQHVRRPANAYHAC